MTYKNAEDFLMHSGVLGMKWGVRKSKEQIAAERKEENFQGLKIDKKKLAIAIGASLSIAGLIATGVILTRNPASLKAAKNLVDDAVKTTNNSIDIFPEEKLAYAAWSKNQGLLNHGLMSPKALALKDVTYPAKHTFFRLSSKAESDISVKGLHSTYHVVDSAKDHKRYINLIDTMGIPGTHGAKASGILFTVKVNTKTPVKIASPKTILDIAKKQGISIDGHEVDIVRDKKFFVYPQIKKELVKQGYHGVVDLDDFGSFAEMPIAFFKEAINDAILTASKAI